MRWAATYTQRNGGGRVPNPASPVHTDNAFGVCARPPVVLQVNDASSKADGHGLRAILRAEFVHDVPDMHFDSLFRY